MLPRIQLSNIKFNSLGNRKLTTRPSQRPIPDIYIFFQYRTIKRLYTNIHHVFNQRSACPQLHIPNQTSNSMGRDFTDNQILHFEDQLVSICKKKQ